MAAATLQGVAGRATDLPGWQLFGQVDRFTYTLVDAQGRTVDVRDHVPTREYWFVDHTMPLQIARWLARTQPERAPLSGTVTVWRRGQPQTHRFVVARGLFVIEPPLESIP